ncbi:hypothetical protein NHQ30_009965 [Ciborinia camelliae]|nr:hypothetical protein NHQ30_009965 [Ciborinia camelliae]
MRVCFLFRRSIANTMQNHKILQRRRSHQTPKWSIDRIRIECDFRTVRFVESILNQRTQRLHRTPPAGDGFCASSRSPWSAIDRSGSTNSPNELFLGLLRISANGRSSVGR